MAMVTWSLATAEATSSDFKSCIAPVGKLREASKWTIASLLTLSLSRFTVQSG